MEKAKRIFMRYIAPGLITFGFIFNMVWVMSVLKSPEYAALVVALSGVAFTFWWDINKQILNARRDKIALLSWLQTELTQNTNVINSIMEIEDGDIEEVTSNPAPLSTHAWLTASVSTNLTSIDTKLINDIVSIYGRFDAANYYAEIFKTITYSPQGTTIAADHASKNAKQLYLAIIRALSIQINQALSSIHNEIEKLK